MDSKLFTAKDLVTAVELLISKQDIRNHPELCMTMLQYFGFTEKDLVETLHAGKYVDFTKRGALGLVSVK